MFTPKLSGHDSAIIRPGTDLPDHFLVATEFGASEPDTTGTCHSPMIDPRDDSSLILFRSAEGEGDYAVENGRYGVGPKEFLRIDCATGKPLGIVKRLGLSVSDNPSASGACPFGPLILRGP